MRKTLFILILATVVLFAGLGLARDKTTMVPALSILLLDSDLHPSSPSVTNIQIAGNAGRIGVDFDLIEPDGDPCSILIEYRGGSVGAVWSAATVTGTFSGLVKGSHTIYWESSIDEPGMFADDLQIRITPSDGTSGTPGVSSIFFIDNATTQVQVVRGGQPYVQDFSAGMPGSPHGWEYYSTNEGRISVVNGRLRLDDETSNSVYSQNEAILHLDLLGQSNVQLSGNHWNLGDETHPGDGIAISTNGVTWHVVAAFDVSSSYSFIVDLDAAVAAAGISYTSDFRINFKQYDNYPAPEDGREWDNIRVEIVAPPTPQVVRGGQPYVQDFSAGMPGSPHGWEYYSTNEGRISVVNGRLRLDDETSNSVYSQNEAILHLDLLGQSNVQLSGNHWNLGDETHPGDGIAISTNGVTWHVVAAFDVSSSYSFIVDLDAAVAAAGISYTSDFRINFKQYDNYPAPEDGREWDNIRVEIVAPPTPQVVRGGQPYVQDFSAGMPGSPHGWEYYSTNEGRISVVNGRLRLDDETSNSVYSQNEAILHLDLLGQSNVQLSGNHWNLGDETHPGDGIAISTNGVTWHVVAAFDVSSSYSFIVDLDAAVAAAGISYTSDFRINFKQYDNYPAPEDGREWDNIRVEIVAPPVP